MIVTDKAGETKLIKIILFIILINLVSPFCIKKFKERRYNEV